MKPKAIKISILVGLFFMFFVPVWLSTHSRYPILYGSEVIYMTPSSTYIKSNRMAIFARGNEVKIDYYMMIEFKSQAILYSYANKMYKISFSELDVEQKAMAKTLSNILFRLSKDNNLEDLGYLQERYVDYWRDEDISTVVYYENGLLKNRFMISNYGPLEEDMDSGKAKERTILKKQYEARDLDEQVKDAFWQLYDSLIEYGLKN
jgi:hypothetical protein